MKKYLIKRGNRKISKSVIIFNMSSATFYTSAEKYCKYRNICYALKAEKLYPEVMPYRQLQANFWRRSTADQIIHYFKSYLDNRKGIKYFRFNEGGDFANETDVYKLIALSAFLKKHYRIETYGYTARYDLFEHIPAHILPFTIKISGYDLPGYDKATIWTSANKSDPEVYPHGHDKNIVCMENCHKCLTIGNIKFKKH